MKDEEVRITRTYTIQQAIEHIVRQDFEYETELGLYGEEG
jgi:hypothetical protein